MLLSECGARAPDDDYLLMDGKQVGCRRWDGRLFAFCIGKSTYVFLRIVWLRQRDPLNDFTPPVLFPNGLRPVFIIIIVSGHTYIHSFDYKSYSKKFTSVRNSTVSLSNLH